MEIVAKNPLEDLKKTAFKGPLLALGLLQMKGVLRSAYFLLKTLNFLPLAFLVRWHKGNIGSVLSTE